MAYQAEDAYKLRIEELMRGSLIEYQEDRPLVKGFGKWFRDFVWGLSTDDETQRDIVQLGQFGSTGYVDLSCIRGIPVTEDLVLDYGFIITKNMDNHLMVYRDDFGYARFSTYGIEHIYMQGKPIKYLHNFQRIFLDYTGKLLHPKVSKAPKEAPVFSVKIKKGKTGDTILSELKELSSRFVETTDTEVDLSVELTPTEDYIASTKLIETTVYAPANVIEKIVQSEPEADFNISFD